MPACFERAIEQLARGSDEGMTREVLGVTRLLANEHDFGAFLGPSPKTVCVPRL